MEPKEDSVRVWVGRNLLQAQFMKQVLADSGIEFLYSELNAAGYEAGIYDYSLWVSQSDAARARTLMQQAEEAMSAELDQDAPSDDDTQAY